jgi:CubicO group peptidase (beta-lactamase class C family)
MNHTAHDDLNLKRAAAFLVALALPGLFGPPSAAVAAESGASYGTAIEQSEQAIESMMDGSGLPGLSIAVMIDGELVWEEAFGFTDLERSVPASPETKFGIGSITKVLTAVLCGRLVDEGKLDWDAPVEEYLPDFKHAGYGITVRNIASHLSGLTTSFDREYMDNTHHFETTQEVLDLYLKLPLEDVPGERVIYSTTSYTVIAAVVEKVTGTDFLTAMENYLINPLNLTQTIPNDPRKDLPERTGFFKGNRRVGISAVEDYDPSYKWAGAGYLSTAGDMAKFGSALLNSDYLEPETLDKIFTRQLTNEGGLTRYAIGWEIGTAEEGRNIYIKSGGGPGISSYLAVYPSQDMVVAILSNLSRAPVSGRLFKQISDAFLAARHG